MESIFCAYDFSDAAKNALKYSCRLAELFSAKLTLVHIYNVPVPVTEYGYVPVGDDYIRDIAVKDLDKLKSQLVKEHPHITTINIIIESGFVTGKINQLASESGCELLVMGIDNDEDFIKEHLVGSTAIDEARKSRVPVLIVPKNAENVKIKSIAYTSDYKHSLVDSSSLIQVKYFAHMFNAELKVVHVLEPDHQIDFAEAVSDKYIESKLSNVDHKTFFVYEKNAAEGISEFAKEHKVDLIIVEPYQLSFFDKLFHKSITKELAFHINKPVLAIHGN